MSTIKVEQVGADRLEHINKVLQGIPHGTERALKSAMTRAVSYLRTNSTRAIRERYAISAANIRAEQNVRVNYRTQNGVTAEVMFSGRKIPLYRYDGSSPKESTYDKSRTVSAVINGRWHQVHPGVAARGHQLRSTSPTKFRNAFVATMRSGHTGIFERNGGASSTGSDAISELMGSSVPQMLGSEEVTSSLTEGVRQKFDERLDHEVSRLLNGYGG